MKTKRNLEISLLLLHVGVFIVLVTHTISTLSPWKHYLDPFNNMLLLAACIVLFLMREEERMFRSGCGRTRGLPEARRSMRRWRSVRPGHHARISGLDRHSVESRRGSF